MPKSDTPGSRRSARVASKAADTTAAAAVGAAAATKSASKDKAATPPSSGSRGALKEGQALPKITLEDEEGEAVDVSGLAGEKGVVIFLYPKADTPGCTGQACGYRDVHDEIGDLGYDVYGLSKDKPVAQQKWKVKKTLNYHLLCDPESKLITKWVAAGAGAAPWAHRAHVDGLGKVIGTAAAG